MKQPNQPHHPETETSQLESSGDHCDLTDFTPVPVAPRHDGWTPDRQVAFIDALAETGCVDRAAKIVGMAVQSAYRLRRRADAQPFRLAWEAALDHAISRLSHAAISRAIHGVARPIFYQGEQVGEWRHYDEHMTRYLLSYRDPVRYGRWRDTREAEQHEDGPALILNRWQNRLTDWAHLGEYDRGSSAEPVAGYEDEQDKSGEEDSA